MSFKQNLKFYTRNVALNWIPPHFIYTGHVWQARATDACKKPSDKPKML